MICSRVPRFLRRIGLLPHAAAGVQRHALDPDRFMAQVLTHSVRGLAWDAIDPSLQAFERMPSGQVAMASCRGWKFVTWSSWRKGI
jgi:hypothetical protein